MPIKRDKEAWYQAMSEAGAGKVALIYHLKISEPDGYRQWLQASAGRFNGKRLFRVKADPVPREGMLIDEIVIDQFPSFETALEAVSSFEEVWRRVCSEYSVLAVRPEPAVTFLVVKCISWLVRMVKGVTDRGTPAARWKADNVAVWPDDQQMRVARAQALDEPLFVYNLNKYKTVADYPEAEEVAPKISGKQAYDRYAKVADFELLRRGAYPVYGGTPICLFSSEDHCMLADRWDHFIFVRYPQRRILLAIIESDQFHQGEVHRDAGLERVAIFMAKQG